MNPVSIEGDIRNLEIMDLETHGRDVKAVPVPPSLTEQVAGMSAAQRYEKVKGMLLTRGVTMSKLAELATKRAKNWPHVTAVLRGLRKGEHTWPRLADFLTQDELVVLGKGDLGKVKVPRGTLEETGQD